MVYFLNNHFFVREDEDILFIFLKPFILKVGFKKKKQRSSEDKLLDEQVALAHLFLPAARPSGPTSMGVVVGVRGTVRSSATLGLHEFTSQFGVGSIIHNVFIQCPPPKKKLGLSLKWDPRKCAAIFKKKFPA